MIDFEDLPRCPTCAAVVVTIVRHLSDDNTKTPSDQVGWACGASASRTLRMTFKTNTFPDGKFSTYSVGEWSTPAGCRNAEEVVRRMRTEQVGKVPK